MGFLDNIGKGISDFGQATIQKGKDVANVAKYNRMISEEEKNISRLFEALGKKYFEMHPEDHEEAFGELFDQIAQSEQKIVEYTDAIKELQGITKCAACGSDVPGGAAFCPECGTRVVRKEAASKCEDESSEKPKKLYCTNCGALIVPGYKYCAACGTKVELPAEVAEVAEEVAEIAEEVIEAADEAVEEVISEELVKEEPEVPEHPEEQ